MLEIVTRDLVALRQDIVASGVWRALNVIGDKSTLLALLGACCGYERFEEWQRQHRMSRSILSKRLKTLVDVGCLDKVPGRSGSLHFRYALTTKGRGLFPWALAVWRWEHAWIHRKGGHPVQIFHEKCQAVTEPRMTCRACKSDVIGNDVFFARTPQFKALSASEPPSQRRSSIETQKSRAGHVGRIVDIIGNRWSYRIVAAAFLGVKRFEDFLKCLEIAPNILSDRLNRLCRAGILAKNCYLDHPKRHEYVLTPKGRDLYSVLVTMGQWSDRWLTENGGPQHVRQHEACGARLHVVATCNRCGGELNKGNISFVRGTVRSNELPATRVLPDEVSTGSSQKTRPNQDSRPHLRINRNEKRSKRVNVRRG